MIPGRGIEQNGVISALSTCNITSSFRTFWAILTAPPCLVQTSIYLCSSKYRQTHCTCGLQVGFPPTGVAPVTELREDGLGHFPVFVWTEAQFE